MVHQRLDVQKWIELFPVLKMREEVRPCVFERWPFLRDWPASKAEQKVRGYYPGVAQVETPYHVAVIEQLRAEAFSMRWPNGRPTDIFAFAKGEPKHRATSKIGGLPYWPSKRAWPIGKSGLPMSFVAQICFSDSMDIAGQLPGEILLIFADGIFGKDWTEAEKHGLCFEWVSLEQECLIDAMQIPNNRWKLHPWYGLIHRTLDYSTQGDLQGEEFENISGSLTIRGTKIGGCLDWIQAEENIAGRFLCSVGSLMPIGRKPISLLPRELPSDYYFDRAIDKSEGYFLVWGDMGMLYLFLDNDGVIHWTIQYH